MLDDKVILYSIFKHFNVTLYTKQHIMAIDIEW